MCTLCNLLLKSKPSHATKRRMPAQDLPVAPRSTRKTKRPWLIFTKRLNTAWWMKGYTDQIPTWGVYKRYATKTARDQAAQTIRNNPYWKQHYLIKLGREV